MDTNDVLNDVRHLSNLAYHLQTHSSKLVYKKLKTCKHDILFLYNTLFHDDL